MRPTQLANYLRANRKRLALSQDDVAFLLGGQSGAKISRYENFTRMPSLETALALEAIYKRAASEIFGGLYQKAERKVAERAKMLVDRKASRFGNQSASRRKLLVELARM
jgi:transcriptional regulator with XRE-family HTH domain